MSLRDSIQQTLRKHFDNLNCALAERALPEERKARVSELSLNRKARQAGQKVPKKIRENI